MAGSKVSWEGSLGDGKEKGIPPTKSYRDFHKTRQASFVEFPQALLKISIAIA